MFSPRQEHLRLWPLEVSDCIDRFGEMYCSCLRVSANPSVRGQFRAAEPSRCAGWECECLSRLFTHCGVSWPANVLWNCERAFSARRPDSSVGGVPVGCCPDDVHMEEEVQIKGSDRRIRRRRRDGRKTRTRTRWGTRREQTIKSHTWVTMQMTWRAPTHSWAMQCDVQQWVRVHCMRKSDTWGVLFTTPVGYSRSPSAVSENCCNNFKKWIELISSTSFWTCPNSTRNELRKKGAIFDTVEKE